jgi:hypothetical protein
VSVRKPDGAVSRFDEIVQPHPVIAFLFRRRTLIVLLGILVLAWYADPKPIPLTIGLSLAALAEMWRIWAAGTIHKTEELTTAGPYAYVRHPLYVGSFMHSIAYCFISGRWDSVLWVPAMFFLLYGAAVSTEEAMLHKLYGAGWEDYCRRVPRFVPRLRRPEPGNGRFEWKQVWANKEHINLIWVAGITLLFVGRLVWPR